MKRKLSILFFAIFCLSFASALDVQTALKQTAAQFSLSLKANSVVAIIGVYSDSPEFSEFMYDELTANFVKEKALTIVDRANLEAIKKEMSFQLSGEVGDESIQQLGAKLGAETVIKGDLKTFGKSSYRLAMRALDVTTAAVVDMYSEIVEASDIELALLSNDPQAVKKVKTKKRKASKPSVAKTGFQNLIFGLGSYKAGHPGDGAVLTIGHLAALGCITGGIIMFTLPNPVGYYPDPNDYASDEDYEYNKNLYHEWDSYHTDLGVILLSSYAVIEGVSILYGFIAPAFYKELRVAKILNPKEDGFHVALNPIALNKTGLKLSYRINY